MNQKIQSKWWTVKKDKYKHVFAVFQQIQSNQKYREQMNSTFARLYGNLPPVALAANPYYSRNSTDNILPNRLTLNVVKSCIDTATSKIATMKTRPFFLTDGGTESQQRRAKKLTHFFDGLFDELKLYQKGQRQFMDGAIFGDGFIKFYIDWNEKRIKAERVFPDEIKVDDLEAIYGDPRTKFQLKLMSRDVLKEMFPKHEEAIDACPKSKLTTGNPMSQSDQVTVIEGWHLPSGDKADDGAHIICIETADLHDKEYKKQRFPFTKFSYGNRPFGFNGVGLAEDLVGIQIDINKTLRVIQLAQHLCAVPRVWIEDSSEVNTEQLTNDIAGWGKYKGIPPIFMTPSAVSPELYNHVESQLQRAYNITGISMLSAANEIPVGIKSGQAMRTYKSVETERFKAVAERYEQDVYMDAVNVLMDLCDELAEADPDFSVKSPSKKTLKAIKWKEVRIDREEFMLRKFPTGFLPETPEGKLEFVQDLLNAQLIPQEHALSLLEYPDLESVTSLINSSRDLILLIIEGILDEGKYETPEPFFDLKLAKKLSQEAYLRGRLNNVDDAKLDLLRLFIADVDKMIQMATPPMPPQIPGMPPGQPLMDPNLPPQIPQVA